MYSISINFSLTKKKHILYKIDPAAIVISGGISEGVQKAYCCDPLYSREDRFESRV